MLAGLSQEIWPSCLGASLVWFPLEGTRVWGPCPIWSTLAPPPTPAKGSR